MDFLELFQTIVGILIISGIVYSLTKSLKRLFQVAGGLVILETYNNIWDLGIWPIIQNAYGIYGVMLLTLMALICNLLVLRWYQKKSNVDWLGITIVDDILLKSKLIKEKYVQKSGVKKIILKIQVYFFNFMEKIIQRKWLPFLLLSLFIDSFIATAFYLHCKNKSVNVPMKKIDYFVFVLSTLISCFAWSIFTELIVLPSVKSLWGSIS